MLQLRDAQNQLATLQAAQAENDKEKKALSDQIATLTQHAKDDKEARDKTIADLNTKISDQEKQIAQLKDVLTKWKESQKQAVDLANAKEAARAKLAANNILLQRRIDDAETKNAQMFRLGNEILTRYEKFGLGDALTAREPFVGTTRIKFKNLVQDYQDKLVDQKIKPESASAKPQQAGPVQGNSPAQAGAQQQPQNTAATKGKPE
jgi:chromosome segregation ATPase